jgi:hypothetical protein
MMHPFSSYEAYIERYKMFWSEEGDGRPPILSETEFCKKFQLLKESYRTYWEMIRGGQESEAAHYYLNLINPLENELAIADGADNFLLDDENQDENQ